jgi:hypothetical protein
MMTFEVSREAILVLVGSDVRAAGNWMILSMSQWM